MARPRGLNTYLRVVSRLRRLTDSPPAPAPGLPPEPDPKEWPDRPEGSLIWVQAADATEARWLDVFVETLVQERGEAVSVLLTTEHQLDPSIGPQVLRLPCPSESGRAVRRFLQHWQPDLGIILNAPNRPVLITEAEAQKTPLFLAATRRSQTTARPRVPLLTGALLDCFDRCLAASASDAEDLRKQGMSRDRIEVTGPLSDIASPLPCDLDLHDRMRALLAGRPVWLAVDLTEDDLHMVQDAYRDARRVSHRLALVIIPRDQSPEPVLARLKTSGWQATFADDLLSSGDGAQIIVAGREDRALWYRVAPITYVGGTFDDDSPAADPFEPALLGSAVIHGPATAPYSPRFQRLKSGGGALPLATTDEMLPAIEYLLAPDRAAEFAHAGWSVTSESAPVIDRLVALTNDVLDLSERA